MSCTCVSGQPCDNPLDIVILCDITNPVGLVDEAAGIYSLLQSLTLTDDGNRVNIVFYGTTAAEAISYGSYTDLLSIGTALGVTFGIQARNLAAGLTYVHDHRDTFPGLRASVNKVHHSLPQSDEEIQLSDLEMELSFSCCCNIFYVDHGQPRLNFLSWLSFF